MVAGNIPPFAKGDCFVSGVDSSNSRGVEEGGFCHVCRTEAGHVFNSVVPSVLLLLEECFAIFRVEGGPSVGHGHVNKGSFASVFEEVNLLHHFLEQRAICFWDHNAYCHSWKRFAIGQPFWFYNSPCNSGECVTTPSAKSGTVLCIVKQVSLVGTKVSKELAIQSTSKKLKACSIGVAVFTEPTN